MHQSYNRIRQLYQRHRHTNFHFFLLFQGECTPDSSQFLTPTGQLSLKHMIGVLYFVYMGIALGLVLIIVEWCVASYWEVDSTDPMVSVVW